jgi:hypothetical protein
MQSVKKCVVGLAAMLLVSAGVSYAGTDLNEVAAFLVYPGVVAWSGETNAVETFVTVTNASDTDVDVHISYINGQPGQYECYECDFDIFLTANDTETLLVSRNLLSNRTDILTLDFQVLMTCPHVYGFMTAAVQDPDTGATLTSNVLLGEEVVVNYTLGAALSVPAVSFQGKNGGNGDRYYAFDDSEYGKMPKVVAADFLAPNDSTQPLPFFEAYLTLFTLDFDRQFPPLVDCSVTGYDAREFDFSTSFLFGCWTTISLEDIHPEFAFPNLGQIAFDTHGWLKLNCRVDSDNNGSWDAIGGVHGAISQVAGPGASLSRIPNGGVMANWAAWARLLYQSVTTGDAVTLHLEQPGGGLN